MFTNKRKFITSALTGLFLFGLSTVTFAEPVTYGTAKSTMDKYAENQVECDGGNLSENTSAQAKKQKQQHASFEDNSSDDPAISVRREKVSQPKRESVKKEQVVKEDKKENTYQPKPYNRRYIYDYVDVYNDGQIVERVPLYKQVVATPTKKDGQIGRQVTITRQYVKGWTVNNNSRIPILDKEETSRFYQEDENHQADVENM